LHLGNICLFEKRPTLFDCIEFNDTFSCIDVLYDLAFLLMDLRHRGLRGLSNGVFNRYLDLTGDNDGLAALPLFVSVRASIRAHVLVAQYRDSHAAQTLVDAQSYLALAGELGHPRGPCVIAIGGLSGTGKSTSAAALAEDFAPAPGARIIRSDVVRNTLAGVAPETRLPVSSYGDTMTRYVYAEMYRLASAILASGYTVILDATFLSEVERGEVARIARQAGVAFFGFWMEAPDDILEQRLKARQRDASDADIKVVKKQRLVDAGIIDWFCIDATLDIPTKLRGMREFLLGCAC
jgi:predicted kinase